MDTAKNMPVAGFVVLSWNGAKLLEACLDSLTLQTEKSFVVCLVDNGSTDNTTAVFDNASLPAKELIVNSYNRGFAPAVNQGVNLLLNRYPELKYVVLLNNDVVLDSKWLSVMVGALNKKPDIDFAQGINYTQKDKKELDCTGIYLEEGMIPRQKITTDVLPNVIGPNAAALIMRQGFVHSMKLRDELLDSRFFAYVEDVDLIIRARLLGKKHAFIEKAVAFHTGSATGNTVSVKKMFWGSRNLVWLLVKNTPLGVIRKKAKKIIISRLADMEYLLRTDRALFWAYLQGMITGIVLSPLFLRDRRTIMKSKLMTNDDFIEMLTPSSPPLTNPVKYIMRKLRK